MMTACKPRAPCFMQARHEARHEISTVPDMNSGHLAAPGTDRIGGADRGGDINLTAKQQLIDKRHPR